MPSRTRWLCVKGQKKTRCENRSLRSNHISMHFFYVENESILVQTPNGKNILYDCGTKSAAERIHCRVRDNDLQVHKIDAMIASHSHSDHVEGFYWFEKIPGRAVIGDLYDNGEVNIDDDWFKDYVKFRDKLRSGGKYHAVKGSMELRVDPDVDIRLYVDCDWDAHSEEYRKYRSVWMTIRYNDATILFEGYSKA